MVKKGRYNVPAIIILILFFISIFLFSGILNRYHIWFEEQLQVFLLTFDHFMRYLAKPAFLSSWLGDFLTQFYWLNWGGALVITTCLFILWILTDKLLSHISTVVNPLFLSLLPATFGFISLCDPEYPLSNIISIIITVSSALVYVSIPSDIARRILGVILVFLLYMASGSSVYIFTVAAIVFEISVRKKRGCDNTVYLLLLTAFTAIIPLALRNIYLLTTGQAVTYLSEIKKNPGFIDFLPVITFILVIPASTIRIGDVNFKINPAISVIVQAFILAGILVAGVYKVWNPDLEKILRFDFEARIERWDKLYDLSMKYNLRNNLASYYANMAMAKLGIMPEKLMESYQPAATGLFIPVNANENYLTITLSNEVYWHLGDVNASQHSALLGTIFSPRAQNSRLMKRLVEINIVNGQYAAAEKFIKILGKTMFHREWAEGMRKYLYNEKACTQADWIRSKRAVIPSVDLLKGANDYIRTLKMLADDHPDNRMAVDYLLCYRLLSKDIDSFVMDFEHYYKPGMDPVLPKVYQEGLLIKIAMGGKTPADYSSFRFTPETISHMAEYTKAYEESNGNGSALMEKYGKTYWFYYHFAALKNE